MLFAPAKRRYIAKDGVNYQKDLAIEEEKIETPMVIAQEIIEEEVERIKIKFIHPNNIILVDNS